MTLQRKYEYKIVTVYNNDNGSDETELNKLGNEGWKVVHTDRIYNPNSFTFVLEREIIPTEYAQLLNEDNFLNK